MMNGTSKENEKFEYTYSAKQQEEIESIRKKYLPKEEDKMETLRRLDQETEKPGTIIALVLGVIGALLFGTGMCCTMVWNSSTVVFVIGILVGSIGIAVAAMAYPAYKKVTQRQRARIAEQILALSNELSG